MTPDWSVLQRGRPAPSPSLKVQQIREATARKTDDILRAFRAYLREHQEVPTLRELRTRLGITSSSVLVYHLDRLVERGDLEHRGAGTSRGYRLVIHPGDPCPFCGHHDASS